jgi:hypothetical protein
MIKNPGRADITVAEKKQFKLLKSESLKDLIQNSSEQLTKLNAQIMTNETRNLELDDAAEKVSSQVLEGRIKLALLQYRIETAKDNLRQMPKQEWKSQRRKLNKRAQESQ